MSTSVTAESIVSTGSRSRRMLLQTPASCYDFAIRLPRYLSGYSVSPTAVFKIQSTHNPQSIYSQRARSFSSSDAEPVIDTKDMQNSITKRASQMATDLSNNGYYTTTDFLPRTMVSLLRAQSIVLRNNGRFEQSWSEKIVNGKAVRFDKEGVFACEPDGQDYYDTPDLIVYMSVLLQTLPAALNGQDPTRDVELSNSSFNAKLAVTSPGGSKYPLHVDNPQGLAVGDTRKLTCILYLNPEYEDGDGGELRILLPSAGEGSDTDNEKEGEKKRLEEVDLTPEGGRLLMFWSDEMPHEVLATAPNGAKDDSSLDRYALTVWIPTTNVTKLHDQNSKFRDLKDLAFP